MYQPDPVLVNRGTLRQEVRTKADGKLVVDAEVIFVMVDKITGKALPMSVVEPVLLEKEAGYAGQGAA